MLLKLDVFCEFGSDVIPTKQEWPRKHKMEAKEDATMSISLYFYRFKTDINEQDRLIFAIICNL